MQYMSICIHEEFRSERCGKMKVILSANTYWELVTRCVHLVCLPIGRSRDSFLFLSRSTCFLSAYSVASPGLRDGNKGWVGHIFALLDFRRDPLGLMKGPFQSHCLFPELVFLVAYQITTSLVWSQLHITRLQLHITRVGQPCWNLASSS